MMILQSNLIEITLNKIRALSKHLESCYTHDLIIQNI